MKKTMKSLLAILLVAVMTIGVMPLNGFTGLNLFNLTAEASDESLDSYPLDVSISSNKTNYGALDKATFTVTIKNVSNSTITNISSKSDFEGILPIGKNNTFNVEDTTLDAGESVEYTYNATINPNELNGFLGFFLKIKRFFSGSQSLPNVNYDDGRNKISEDITVKFSSVEITDTVSVWYKHNTEIINASTEEEFSNKVMELVNESLNDENFDKEAALEDEYYMCRVIANINDFSVVDFSVFNAETIVINDDGTVVLQFANRDLAKECTDYLNSLSNVVFAEADAYVAAPEEVEIESIPDLNNSIWGEKYINADKYAHYLENNNFNNLITVAVVDTGIDMDHPYFNGRLSGGRNCFDGSSFPEDDTGHGTHVSGIVVNCTNNLNIKVMPIKSLNAGGGTLNSIVSGINYAISQRVQVINLSLESPYNRQSKYLENAINDAVSKGIIVVVAAGNGEKITHTPVDTANVSPANMENVIVVGALDETGTKGSFSNYGESVDVIAPGVAVPSTYLDGKYALMSGTSQAAPHIAAVAAMFKLAYPDYNPSQIEALVKQYCVDKGPEGRDDFYGVGCPDMYNAIPDCTVSFNSNGGSQVNSATTKNSSSVVLPTPTREYTVTLNANGGSLPTSSYTKNCTFDGWYKTSSFTGQKYLGGESYMLLEDQTMYAKWTNPKLYEFSINEPTRTGFYFTGWYDASTGGTKYSSTNEISGNKTMYAQWIPNDYIVKWSTNPTYTISVTRMSSPYANAYIGSISNNSTIYYGDVLQITYTANSGYTISAKGATNITVTGDVNSNNIYATTTPNSYTYNIIYKSSNGTNLGSSSVTYKYGTTNTIKAPAKSGYITPAAQTVDWNSTSPKTITFSYVPQSVGSTTFSGDVSSSPGIKYSARVEHRNRTANSIQIRVCWTSTIRKRSYTQYGQQLNITAGGTTKSVTVLPFNTWKSQVDYERSSGEKCTDWITVPLNTTNATTVNVAIYYYQFNSNGTDMKYNGTETVSTTWNVSVPAY